MNTEELKTFIFLSKVKNFTLAAEQLQIAQSTVTNRISELEKEVGKKLSTAVQKRFGSPKKVKFSCAMRKEF
jgi:DNA-binding transcriptional LysR family regulator